MNLSGLLQKVSKRIYPENCSCYLCNCDVFDGRAFCRTCRADLPYNTKFCVRCGREIVQEGYCADCRQRQPLFYKARSVFVYKDQAVGLIHAFKNGEPTLSKAFAEEGAEIVKREFSDVDFIAFTPIGGENRKKRGYNQAELLAKSLGEKCGKETEELFTKERETREQKTLTKEERQKNLRGSFRLHRRGLVKGKKILLVDDLLTTGATVEELTRLLYGAGARRVYVFTVASVRLQRD